MILKESQNSMRYPSVDEVVEIFNGRCPKCRRGYSTVHELEPRSRGTHTLRMQNRTAICYYCHIEYHNLGASKKNIAEWTEIIKKYLTSIGRYEEYLNWGKDAEV